MIKKISKISLWIMVLSTISCSNSDDANKLSFSFKYEVEFHETGKIEAWIPIPQSDDYQNIKDLGINTKLKYSVEFDRVYRNKYIHITDSVDNIPEIVQIIFDVTTIEKGVHDVGITMDENKLFLAETKMVPASNQFEEIAQRLNGIGTDFARSTYDYVLDHMEYDKSGEGWGQGDALYACDIGRGNCTDFHSLFNAIVRTRKIPARFNIGFPLNKSKSGQILGYHCWTEFYVENVGWTPVDISEADKNPELVEYYFGHLDNRRLRFTTGRDIRLPGGTEKDVVNFSIYPYVKINDIVSQNYTKRIFYEEI